VEGLPRRTIAHRAAVRIPLGTVVWEKTAFPAVLPAILEGALPTRTARVSNALISGLWHVQERRRALMTFTEDGCDDPRRDDVLRVLGG
jgi:hypothetical protein